MSRTVYGMDGTAIHVPDREYMDSEENYLAMRSWRHLHDGGTKEYHVIQLTNVSRNAYLVLTRWNASHTDGQMMIERFPNAREANTAFVKKVREKEKRGYKDDLRAGAAPKPLPHEKKFHFDELGPHLHPVELSYVKRFGADLFGGIGVTMDQAERADLVEEETPEAPQSNFYESDSQWGMF